MLDTTFEQESAVQDEPSEMNVAISPRTFESRKASGGTIAFSIGFAKRARFIAHSGNGQVHAPPTIGRVSRKARPFCELGIAVSQ
jgi:hypothetical protein